MHAQEVTFQGQDREIDAYVAWPDGEGRHAAVIVIHEIWGLMDHIRDVARRFAEQGYVALAPDLYTGPPWHDAMQPEAIMAGMQFLRTAPPEVQRDPSRLAGALQDFSPAQRTALQTLMQVMQPKTRAGFAVDLRGAMDFLRSQEDVDGSRIACLGFCMGGGITAQLATKAPDLWRAVIFYGENPDLAEVPKIGASVLGLYGGEDPRITDGVPAFAQAMEEAGKSFTYRIFPGAPHAFFNDSREATYRPEAAREAWQDVLHFLG